MNKVDGSTILYDGFVTIYFGLEEKAEIVRFMLHQGEETTLDDCKDMMIDYDESENVLYVIWETPLEGVMYAYNNYGDRTWRKCGKTDGYA